MNIEFAYPTQTLFLRRDANETGAPGGESGDCADKSSQALTGARPTL